jgi:SAM-dependent methyltransferase
VLDVGCGYGEFINQVQGPTCYAMDLNPEAGRHLHASVEWLKQDCSQPWPLQENSLDLVFSSNFFEHLPDEQSLLRTLQEAYRCLRPGGRLIALGPNMTYVGDAYWDFPDHYLALTESSLGAALQTTGFTLERVIPRFLPYTMSDGRRYPLFMVRLYLRMPITWRFLGRQFLVMATK